MYATVTWYFIRDVKQVQHFDNAEDLQEFVLAMLANKIYIEVSF